MKLFRARWSRGALLALPALLALSGCRAEDVEKPSAPTLDAQPRRTIHREVLLSGAAEPGATIVVLRTPGFPADFLPPATRADASTARFSMRLPLEAGRTNTFAVTAVDSQGQPSDPAIAEFEQVSASPGAISLLLENRRVAVTAAGKATIHARAAFVPAEPGAVVAGLAVEFRIADYPQSVARIIATTDDDGVAIARFPLLSTLGPGRVVAELENGTSVPDSAAFEILPGPPVSAFLELSATVNGTPVTGTAITVPAGAEVRARVTAKDPTGALVPVVARVETAPADTFIAGGVLRFVHPGTYTVTAEVPRADGSEPPRATGTVTVVPAPAGPQGALRLLVSLPPEAVSDVPLAFTAKLVDGSGQAFEPATLTATITGSTGSLEAAARRLTLRGAGVATIVLRATTVDGAPIVAPVASLVVRPGPPASLSVLLAGAPAPFGAPRSTAAAAEVPISALVKDAAGNVIDDAPVALFADLGVTLFGGTVIAPTRAGVYTISGVVAGTPLRALAALSVTPSAADHVELSCPAVVDAGIPFRCSAAARDAFGEALPVTLVWAALPASAATVVNGRVTTELAGALRISATVTGLAEPAVATITVRPGPATTLRLTVSPATAVVGSTVTASYSVVDAFLNVLTLPVLLSSDAPDAIATATTLANLTTAGAFHAFATLAPAPGRPALTAVANFSITAASAATLALTAQPQRSVTGSPIALTVVAADPFGNPSTGTPSYTVDGALPALAGATIAAGNITFGRPGAFRLVATLGAATASVVLDVLPAPDTVAPQIALAIEGATAEAGAVFFHPGETVRVRVRARDGRGLAGLQLRASGPSLGVVHEHSEPLAQRPTELDELVTFVLPADRVGSFSIVAAVTDVGGQSASAAPADGLSDLHFDRLVTATGVVARSVSIDSAALRRPAGLAFAGTTLHATDVVLPLSPTLPTGASVVRFGPGGAVVTAWDLGDQAAPYGLAAVSATGGGAHLFTAGLGPTTSPITVLRLVTGAPAPQTYSIPPLSLGAGTIPGGLAVNDARTVKLGYLAETAAAESAATRSRLWSFVAKGAAAASIDSRVAASPREAWSLPLTAHRARHVCVAPSATAGTLYFTGERFAGATAYVGLYAVTLQVAAASAGHVPAASTPVTVFEQLRGAAPATDVFGPCLFLPAAAAAPDRLAFTRWVVDANGVGASGRLVQVAATCNGSCAAVDLASGTGPAPLGALEGLLRGVDGSVGGPASIYVAESADRRVFRIDGIP